MSEPPSLDPLLPAIRDLAGLLEESGAPGVFIGAAAVAILSQPRLTRDVDVLVMLDPDRWVEFLQLAARHGLEPRISDALAFARKRRVLLLVHQPTGVGVDISFGALPFESEAILRSRKFNLEGVSISIPTPEDMVIMKAVAGRGKDYADIEQILNANPETDRDRVRHWLGQFAEVLEMPEMITKFENFFGQRKSKK